MTSEIRANTLKNRVGLGTVEYSNTGPVISGVTTSNNFKTGSTNIHSVGVEAAGINVLGADTPIGTGATIYNSGAAVFTGIITASKATIGSELKVSNLTSGRVVFTTSGGQLESSGNLTYDGSTLASGTPLDINGDLDVDGHTNLDNVSIAGVSTVTTFLQVLGIAGTSDKGLEVRANSTQSTDTNQAIRVRNNSNTDTFKVSYKGYVNNRVTELTEHLTTPTAYLGDSIIHHGDLDTKIRFPSGDNISFETGGGERLSINSTGRSTFSGQVFQSNTSTTVFPTSWGTYAYTQYSHELVIDNNATGTQGSFAGIYFNAGADSDGSKVGTARISAVETGNYKADLVFSTRNTAFTEKVRIAADGQITQTAASGDTVFTLKRSDTNTTGLTGGINFAASDGHSVASIQSRGDGDNEGAHLQFYTTTSAAGDMFNAANVERLRIGSSGEIHLGTSNWPTGSIGKAAGRVMMGNEGSLTIWNETNSAGGGGTLKLACKEGSNAARVGFVNLVGGTENTSDRSGFLQIQVSNSSGSGLERLRIDSSGRMLVSGPLGYGNIPFGGNPANAAIQIRCNDKYKGIAFGENAVSGCIGLGGAESTTALVYTANAHPANLGGGTIKTHEWHSGTAGGGGPGRYMSLDTDGDLSLDYGSLKVVDGQGIDFSATPNSSGSMTSELLDYYEEGTWTPTIYRSNNSGVSGNYNHQQGSYVRIGRLVFVIFAVDIASFSGGSGHTVMGGLPFSTHGHGVGGWNYVANMRRMYLDGDYARGVDANSLVAAGGITYMYNMNLDDDQWNYTNYGRILFEGTFTYQTS